MLKRLLGPARCLALMFLLLSAPAAIAQPASGIDGFMESADQFDRLVEKARPTGKLPKLSDPAAALLLRRLADSRATLGDKEFGPDDFTSLLAAMNRTLALVSLYTNHGVDPGMTPAESEKREVLNTIEYQDESMPLLFTLIDDYAQLVLIVEKIFLSRGGAAGAGPGERSDLVSMRQNSAEMLRQLLIMIASPQIRATHRDAGVEAVNRNLSTYVPRLSLAERQAISQEIRRIRRGFEPGSQAKLDGIATAMSSTHCEHLCTL